MGQTSKAWSLTFARIALGFIVFVHGMANSFGVFGGPGIEKLAADMAMQVDMAPSLLAHLVAYGQLLFGLSLLLGLWASISAWCVFALVVLHVFSSARYRTFFVRDDGIEYLLAVAALCSIVAIHGPGAMCLKWPRKPKPKP